MLASFVLLAILIGQFFGRVQTNFDEVVDRPNFVIVRVFGDVVVTAKVDRETGQFLGEYFVAKVDADDLKLHLKQIKLEKPRPMTLYPERSFISRLLDSKRCYLSI